MKTQIADRLVDSPNRRQSTNSTRFYSVDNLIYHQLIHSYIIETLVFYSLTLLLQTYYVSLEWLFYDYITYNES